MLRKRTVNQYISIMNWNCVYKSQEEITNHKRETAGNFVAVQTHASRGFQSKAHPSWVSSNWMEKSGLKIVTPLQWPNFCWDQIPQVWDQNGHLRGNELSQDANWNWSWALASENQNMQWKFMSTHQTTFIEYICSDFGYAAIIKNKTWLNRGPTWPHSSPGSKCAKCLSVCIRPVLIFNNSNLARTRKIRCPLTSTVKEQNEAKLEKCRQKRMS